jgi:FAD:protein FMN transferase
MTNLPSPTTLPTFPTPTALPTTPTLPTVPRIAVVEQVMGLPVSIHVRGPRARGSAAAEAMRSAFDVLRSADLMFSTYRADSQVSRIDRGELSLADADPMVREVCELADEARALTGGLFDIRSPDSDGRMRFDPSGLVKGWAAERAAFALEGLDEHDFMLNAGGDVVVGGAVAFSDSWSTGPGRSRRLARQPGVCTCGIRARANRRAGCSPPRSRDPR